MKYLLTFIWYLIVNTSKFLWYTILGILSFILIMLEILIFMIINFSIFIWYFNFKHFKKWSNYKVRMGENSRYYYTDKNMFETYLRYCRLETSDTPCDEHGKLKKI